MMTIGEHYPATPCYKTPNAVTLYSRDVCPLLGFL
jgi:hypothetical protein